MRKVMQLFIIICITTTALSAETIIGSPGEYQYMVSGYPGVTVEITNVHRDVLGSETISVRRITATVWAIEPDGTVRWWLPWGLPIGGHVLLTFNEPLLLVIFSDGELNIERSIQ